jgi:hypothetical protein
MKLYLVLFILLIAFLVRLSNIRHQLNFCSKHHHIIPSFEYKLQFRSKQCTFLGYSGLHKGYKYLDISTDSLYISRDVIFDESVFHLFISGRMLALCSVLNFLFYPLFRGILPCWIMRINYIVIICLYLLILLLMIVHRIHLS